VPSSLHRGWEVHLFSTLRLCAIVLPFLKFHAEEV